MAGSNAIASGSTILTANADGLATGLGRAGAMIQTWGMKQTAGLNASLGGKAAGGGMLSGLAGTIGKAGPWVAAGVAAGTALYEGIDSAAKRLGDIGKYAKQGAALGIAPSQMMGLDKALAKVGVEGDQVTAIFAKMGKTISMQTPAAAAAFEMMGLSVQELAGLTLDQSFLRIADGIAKLPPGIEQSTAALSVFGKAGAQLLPMFQKGGKGIQEFIDHQKQLGGVLSDSEITAAGDAAKAWKAAKADVSAAWEGAMNRLALAAAPLVKTIGGSVERSFKLLGPPT